MEELTKEERIQKYLSFMPEEARIPVEILEELGFFTAPASKKYHGAYEGGLFDHSYLVAEKLVDLTEKLGLVWERPRSPYLVGMFHDLCKCDLYVEEKPGKYAWNDAVIYPDHGPKSVMLASRYLRLTLEEEACIRWHMGAYEENTEMWDYYGHAVEKYHNVLFTHTADMFASHCVGV